MDRSGCRQPVRVPQAGDPVRREAPPTTGPGRHRRRPTGRARGPGARRRRPHPRAVQLDASRPDRRRADARAPGDSGAPAGRGPDRDAGPGFRPGRDDVALRHPLALAGGRRPRPGLPARRDRPGAVSPPRRPAVVGPRPGRRRHRWQRVHGGVGDPRGAATGPGLGPADPLGHRPGRRGGARLPALDRALRRLPAPLAAAVLGDNRSRAGPGRLGSAGRRGRPRGVGCAGAGRTNRRPARAAGRRTSDRLADDGGRRPSRVRSRKPPARR